ncbi:MAG: sporulation protein YqfD [Clostridia bacterium]|nr:sporulation protein YqfD [Clostridia bacterium]
MLIKLIRLIKGYLVFEIIGKFPERFINLCLRQGYFLFGVTSDSDGFTASMLLSDYREIRPVARKAKVRLKIIERHGLPFFLHRYRMRRGLIAGLAAFFIIIQAMQGFVWTVEINGMETVSESSITELLREEGLYQGAYKNSLNLQSIERSLMQQVDEIGWMSVNIIGTKAEVEIKEKEIKPQIIDTETPCNIKASQDGVILSINTRQGTAKTMVGSAVKKGQLLVSGIKENSLEEVSFVHADAQVIAQTDRKAVFSLQPQGEYSAPADISQRKNLIFCWLRVPFGFSAVSGEYSSRIITEKIFLDDTCIELGTVTESCTRYINTPYNLTAEQAEKRLSADEALYRLFVLQNCLTVDFKKSISQSESSDVLTVHYTCTEDIALSEKIIVN